MRRLIIWREDYDKLRADQVALQEQLRQATALLQKEQERRREAVPSVSAQPEGGTSQETQPAREREPSPTRVARDR